MHQDSRAIGRIGLVISTVRNALRIFGSRSGRRLCFVHPWQLKARKLWWHNGRCWSVVRDPSGRMMPGVQLYVEKAAGGKEAPASKFFFDINQDLQLVCSHSATAACTPAADSKADNPARKTLPSRDPDRNPSSA
jgi:hypothetical protein